MTRSARHGLLAAALCIAAAGALADDAAPRWRATVEVRTPAAFVALPLPISVYQKSLQRGLADLRLVDARGERVPFALLGPQEGQAPPGEALREVAFFPLPPSQPGTQAGGDRASPVDIRIDGEHITLSRRAGLPAAADARTPGWLFDLGDRQVRPAGDARLQALRLRWSAPAEFSAAYSLEVSDDLREWRRGSAGQIMALAPAGTGRAGIEQPLIALDAATPRFVRLVWADPATAPRLNGAQAVSASLASKATTTEILAAASAPPKPGRNDDADETKRALFFDLGAVLPVQSIELRGPAGTWVAPVQVQGRDAASDAWRPLGLTVFYQLERGGQSGKPPPWAVSSAFRHLRLLPDARAATLDAAQVQLAVRASLATLVFPAQGQPPYTLLAGAKSASPGASPGATSGPLPATTLVPDMASERLRFGQAALGAWHEDAEAASSAETSARWAALRPWLLWAVLLGGVAGLGFMVWRLARGSRGKAR